MLSWVDYILGGWALALSLFFQLALFFYTPQTPPKAEIARSAAIFWTMVGMVGLFLLVIG